MGKMLDPQNVVMRAERMMRGHLKLFEEYFGEYERDGSRYCFSVGDDARVSIYYESTSKLLSKTFSTTIKLTLSNVLMEKDWKAKLNLSGVVKVESIALKELDKDSRDVVCSLNENNSFMNRIFPLFKDFDVQTVIMEYKKQDQELNITIRPYPGAFIWVKLPPVYYDIKFKPEEVKRIYDITEVFSNFFKLDCKDLCKVG